LAIVSLFVAAAIAFVALQLLSAPYGRHARDGWGPTIGQRWGWVGMEIPTLLVFYPVFWSGSSATDVVPVVFCLLWAVHYVHRTAIFPFRIKASTKRTPLVIVALAFLFQVVNSWVNAAWVSDLGHYELSWLVDPRFVAGLALFVGGQVVNHHSDHILFNLRGPGETGYKVPYGGLYRFVSCPNYLGELMTWAGWALATWSWAGLAFLVFTLANLIPRALENHRWYLEKFPDYPSERKAVLPLLL
jgi:protein-S-isoprenylcysteine O-methyltransferase Ste14